MEKKIVQKSASSKQIPYVEFQCTYTPNIAGGPPQQFASELYPLRCDYHGTHQLAHANCSRHQSFTSVQFQNPRSSHTFRVVVEQHLPEDGANSMLMPFYEGGAYNDKIDVAQFSASRDMAASTSVVLTFYATTFTTNKQTCNSNVGTAVVSLAELQSAAKRSGKLALPVVFDRNCHDKEGVKQVLTKGSVMIDSINLHDVKLRSVAEFDVFDGGHHESLFMEAMRCVIKRGQQTFFSKDGKVAFLSQPTEKFLKPFHVPEFATPRAILPSCVYALLKPSGPINIQYCENMLAIAMKRSWCKDANEFLQWSAFIDGEPLTHQSHAAIALCVRMLVAFPLSQCYLDDFANMNKNGAPYKQTNIKAIEDFHICRNCRGDDCEGCFLEAMMLYQQITNCTEDEARQMSQQLRRARTILQLFVPFMTLGCVTNAKATTRKLDKSNAMAHTFFSMMFFWQMYDMMHAGQQKELLTSKFYKSRAELLNRFKPSTQDKKNYKPNTMPLGTLTITGESTAPIDPTASAVEAYYESAELQKVASVSAEARRVLLDAIIPILENSRVNDVLQPEVLSPPDKLLKNAEGLSGFYRYFMSGCTPVFVDLRRLDFAFGFNVNNDAERTYGVPFESIIFPQWSGNDNNKQKPGMMAYLELSEQEAKACDAILLDYPPVAVLEPMSEENKNTIKRRHEAFTAKLDRIRDQEHAHEYFVGTDLHPRIQFITVREDDITPLIESLIIRIVNLQQVHWFDYSWHFINNAVGGTQDHNAILDIYLHF